VALSLLFIVHHVQSFEDIFLYIYLVKKMIVKRFANITSRHWDVLLKAVAPNVHHRFAGVHSLGGKYHNKGTLHLWFERLGRVVLSNLKVNSTSVNGWPWHTTVFVQYDVTATLFDGNDSYFNRSLHVITLRWGSVYVLDVFEDTQEVARSLAAQVAAGLKEAVATQIVC